MARKAFSLLEIVIVVAVIGILAFIVIPQFSSGAAEARQNALVRDLGMIRQQIELFKAQHAGVLLGQGGRDIVAQLTGKTDIQGNVVADGAFGPYMRIFPMNPYTNTDTVELGTGSPGGGNFGWYYHTGDGGFYADDDAHKDW